MTASTFENTASRLSWAKLLRAAGGAQCVGLTVAALLAIGAVSIVTGGGGSTAGPEVLRLEVKSARFSESQLTATGRTVTVRVTNHDLFWHTFTIAELGIDLKLPVGGEKELTFTAPPGAYTYVCAVPGHATFMRGTLTVR